MAANLLLAERTIVAIGARIDIDIDIGLVIGFGPLTALHWSWPSVVVMKLSACRLLRLLLGTVNVAGTGYLSVAFLRPLSGQVASDCHAPTNGYEEDNDDDGDGDAIDDGEDCEED